MSPVRQRWSQGWPGPCYCLIHLPPIRLIRGHLRLQPWGKGLPFCPPLSVCRVTPPHVTPEGHRAQPWCCSPPEPQNLARLGSDACSHYCPWFSLQVLVVWDETSNKVRNYRVFEKVSRLSPLRTWEGGAWPRGRTVS